MAETNKKLGCAIFGAGWVAGEHARAYQACARTKLVAVGSRKEESARNKAVRDFTVKAFADMGYKSTDAQGNFIFTDIGKTMTAAQFRDACLAKGVMVGRDFPPLEKQWARISLGTMEEMQKATEVFRSVLKTGSSTSAGKER